MKPKCNPKRIGPFLCCCLLFWCLAAPLSAADVKPVKPTPKDKCPVCGMFVSKYPDWVAQLVFRDGTRLYFDGVKDLMKFYLNPSPYQSTRSRPQIAAVFVTDYYSLEPIEGTRALLRHRQRRLRPHGPGVDSFCQGIRGPGIPGRSQREKVGAFSGDHSRNPENAGLKNSET